MNTNLLTEICQYLKNWFVYDTTSGTFTISGGAITLPSDFKLLDGQYFCISGSALNDGVHLYPASDLKDEEFSGTVVSMAVPAAVVALAEEIDAWCVKYKDAVDSPYNSESFKGYSYTKSASGGGSDGSGGLSWHTQFKARLAQWRKL